MLEILVAGMLLGIGFFVLSFFIALFAGIWDWIFGK